MSAEAAAITTFIEESDRAGLPIPGDIDKIYQELYLALEKPLAPSSFEDQLGWPPRSVRPVVALAQHYGIPTRPLDCSRSAYIAAYFAAADVLRNNKIGEMALWAISTTWRAPADPNYQRTYPVLIMAPYASNPNLRAQQGVHLGVPVNLELHNSASRDDFAVLLSHIDASMRPYGLAALKKFTLPAREAPQLLWYLRKHGYWFAIVSGVRGRSAKRTRNSLGEIRVTDGHLTNSRQELTSRRMVARQSSAPICCSP